MKRFVCNRCGQCCRWPGCVKLELAEIAAIAAFLGWSEEDFLARYTQLRPDRSGLALLDNADKSCIFLTGQPGATGCLIEPVKPAQCRKFPDEWNFPGWQNECKGHYE